MAVWGLGGLGCSQEHRRLFPVWDGSGKGGGGKLKVRAGGWRLQAGSVYLESIIQLGNDNKQPK